MTDTETNRDTAKEAQTLIKAIQTHREVGARARELEIAREQQKTTDRYMAK